MHLYEIVMPSLSLPHRWRASLLLFVYRRESGSEKTEDRHHRNYADRRLALFDLVARHDPSRDSADFLPGVLSGPDRRSLSIKVVKPKHRNRSGYRYIVMVRKMDLLEFLRKPAQACRFAIRME